jgi:hypothetical protein
MTLIESEIIDAIITRLQAFLPEKMMDSVTRHPNRPEEVTEDILNTCYPHGLFTVQCPESEADGDETLFFTVHAWVTDIDRSYVLARAAKTIVNGLAPFGARKLKLSADKIERTELGVWVRSVGFSFIHPAPLLSEANIAAKIAELEL